MIDSFLGRTFVYLTVRRSEMSKMNQLVCSFLLAFSLLTICQSSELSSKNDTRYCKRFGRCLTKVTHLDRRMKHLDVKLSCQCQPDQICTVFGRSTGLKSRWRHYAKRVHICRMNTLEIPIRKFKINQTEYCLPSRRCKEEVMYFGSNMRKYTTVDECQCPYGQICKTSTAKATPSNVENAHISKSSVCRKPGSKRG